MTDQTVLRVCLILGSFITAGYILRRVRHASATVLPPTVAGEGRGCAN